MHVLQFTLIFICSYIYINICTYILKFVLIKQTCTINALCNYHVLRNLKPTINITHGHKTLTHKPLVS